MLDELPSCCFRTVYADPPWPERGAGKIKRGADAHYPLMSVSEIAALGGDVSRVAARTSHLWLWVTNSQLVNAVCVVAAWGFRYVNKVTWVKDQPGLGQYLQGQSEDCWLCVRGHSIPKTNDRPPTVLHAPVGVHSEKPEGMRNIVERVSRGPFLELFARRRKPIGFWDSKADWSYWGNEAPFGNVPTGVTTVGQV